MRSAGRQASPAHAPPFHKVLIANRGEIAVRLIRACRELGIRTAAVYSEVDREALHVRLADEAYPIGPAQPAQSYLNIERILDAARQAQATAVHPGYGFLAENPSFARACHTAGLIFIGPPAAALEAAGDKVRARELMARAGLPVVPGTLPLSHDHSASAQLAAGLGYPVLLKASRGGGGRGMRIARSAEQLPSLLAQARSEASSAFGDDTVFMEKLIEHPRHIEVQILADGAGHCIHLGERECSIQRRHQKLIEESPSPAIDPSTRERLGRLATAAASAVGYQSAGTVEFLRGADGALYFIEINARLQVEHPLTEMVTGIDLVKEMLRLAAGKPVPAQTAVELRGHAIECRILAEDPTRNFMPSPGKIRNQRLPGGPGIRYDGGTEAGCSVPDVYDALIGKLIAWGADRQEAIARMRRALQEMRFDGLATSIAFHRRVMDHPAFQRAELHTGFIEEHPELLEAEDDAELCPLALRAVAVAHLARVEAGAASAAATRSRRGSAWKWQRRGS